MTKLKYQSQQGAVLIMSVIVLTILLIANASLMRVNEASTMVAGNIAMREIVASTGDVGVDIAVTSLNAVGNKEVGIPNRYFATQQPADANGLPTTIDWNTIPTTAVQNLNVQFVLERLCSGAMPVADFNTQCTVGPALTMVSNKAGSVPLTSEAVYYRATVRVTGPRNSLSFIQAILRQ